MGAKIKKRFILYICLHLWVGPERLNTAYNRLQKLYPRSVLARIQLARWGPWECTKGQDISDFSYENVWPKIITQKPRLLAEHYRNYRRPSSVQKDRISLTSRTKISGLKLSYIKPWLLAEHNRNFRRPRSVQKDRISLTSPTKISSLKLSYTKPRLLAEHNWW